jgi:hypothetical protein
MTLNLGLVQGSDIFLNQTLGPVLGSQKFCKNLTEPDRGITIWLTSWADCCGPRPALSG